MAYNIVAYGFYLSLSIIVILKVGQICYQNGLSMMQILLEDQPRFCFKVNRTLLLGYYLLNIGYVLLTLISWKPINSMTVLMESVCFKVSLIVLIIAVLHYINLIVVRILIKNFLK